MHVEVSEYNSGWPRQFEAIKHDLEIRLKHVSYISVEHVGSTSVPGLSAKAVIDIDIIVPERTVQEAIEALTLDGTYYSQGERGIPGRHAIQLTDGEEMPKRNIYVCIDGCQALRNHLTIRDICRGNDEIRDEYARFKRELSTREWRNTEEYAQAKTLLLTGILSRAGFDTDEIQQIAAMNGVTI